MAEPNSRTPGIDPTANVLSLVELAVKRLDDLRVEANRRQDVEIECAKTISTLLAGHVKELGDMRSTHGREMAVAESRRLDAVRAVDVLNGSTAAERSQVATQVLAAKTAADAENIRTALTATAAAIAQQSAINNAAMTERIAALEKSSYEGKGKSTITDPAMTELLSEVKRLAGVQAGSTGKSEGMEKLTALGLAVAGAVIAAAVYFK